MARAEVEAALPHGPAIAGIALQQLQVVGDAVALQPGERGLQLGQRHHRAALAHHPLERGRVGVVRHPRRAGCGACPRPRPLAPRPAGRPAAAARARAGRAGRGGPAAEPALLRPGGGEVRPGGEALPAEGGGIGGQRHDRDRRGPGLRRSATRPAGAACGRGRACPARARSAPGSGGTAGRPGAAPGRTAPGTGRPPGRPGWRGRSSAPARRASGYGSARRRPRPQGASSPS